MQLSTSPLCALAQPIPMPTMPLQSSFASGPINVGAVEITAKTHVANFLGFSGAVSASGYPAIVESLTLMVHEGEVEVNSDRLQAGATISWGNGDTNNIEMSNVIIKGAASDAKFSVHWESV